MSDVIVGKDLLVQVCKTIGIDPNVTRRVVLDIPYNNVVKVYVEMMGTDALLDVYMSQDGISIKEVGNVA